MVSAAAANNEDIEAGVVVVTATSSRSSVNSLTTGVLGDQEEVVFDAPPAAPSPSPPAAAEGPIIESNKSELLTSSIGSVPSFVTELFKSPPQGDDDDKIHHHYNGLTQSQYDKNLEQYGYNEVVVKDQPLILQLLSRYLGIVPLFMMTAAVLSAAIESTCSQETPFLNQCPCRNANDWASFVLLLIELNLVVYADFMGSRSSGDAMKKLQEASASTVGTKRDGNWTQVPTRELVPGDLVAITIGMTIPADGIIVDKGGEPIKLDYSSLTGEPLPEKKAYGESVLSGAVVLVGESEMVVARTGPSSSLGTTQALIAEAKKEKETGGELARILSRVVIFLCAFGVVIAVFVGAFSAQIFQYNAAEAIKASFVLLSAILPVTMPLILTTTLAVGARELANDQAVVQRFSAIPEMAQMDILCSDKTGTLTLGEMTVIPEESVVFGSATTVETMMEYALIATRIEHSDAIDAAITNYFGFEKAQEVLQKYNISKFIPFDPSTKRVTAVATKNDTGEEIVVVKGAPPVLMKYAGITERTYQKAQAAMTEKSARGYKTLAVCIEVDENEWRLLGLMSILDPPRSDTAHTVKKCNELGVQVKMITGDQRLIAVEVARQLQIPNLMIYEKDVFHPNCHAVDQAGGFGALCERAGGFAGVSPEHKHRVVTSLQDRHHFVGMTGDGVNDAPALSIANVGIAVAGATDAARGASDIVLQQEGLSTIVKAIYGSRIIFYRINTYLTYRMSCSLIFGLFFTLVYCASEYNFPNWTLLIASLLNDFVVSSSSKDQVPIQRRPTSLNIWRSGATAAVIAICSSMQMWGLVTSLVKYNRITNGTHFMDMRPNDPLAIQFTGCEIAGFTFLLLVLTIQSNLIAARSPKPFFWISSAKDDQGHYLKIPPPAPVVLIMISLSMTIATFIAVYWRDDLFLGSGYGMEGIGWRNAGLVWAWAIAWFLATDLIKFLFRRIWDALASDDLTFHTMYRNIFGIRWNVDYDRQERDERLASLRDSLQRFQTIHTTASPSSEALDASTLSASAARLFGGSVRSSVAAASAYGLGLAAGLAATRELDDGEANRLVTLQDILLASETLENDEHLMRVMSQMIYTIAKLQSRLDKLEGKEPGKKKLTIADQQQEEEDDEE